MDKINVFIVGAGIIAYTHAKNLPYEDKAVLAGIIEIDDKKAEDFCKAYPGIKAYNNIEAFLNEKPAKNDLVIVATPPFIHYEICSKLIKKGYNVLSEKPHATNLKEALELKRLAHEHRVKAASCESRFVGFQPVQLAAEYIRSGKLGKVYLVEQTATNRLSRNGIEYQPESKWFLSKKASGGGPFIDWGVYDLAVLQTVMGGLKKCEVKYSKLMNKLAPVPKEIEDMYNVEEHGFVVSDMTCCDGTEFTYAHERSTVINGPEQWSMKIIGTEGGIEMRWLAQEARFEYYYTDEKLGPIKITEDITSNYDVLRFPLIDILDAISEDKEPSISFDKAMLHIDYVDQLYTKSGFYK